MNKSWVLKVVAFFLGWLICINSAYASDHQDSPLILETPVLDISDLFAFTSQEQPSHLVLIMNTLPLASESSWFADAFDYSIIVRPTSVSGTGNQSGFTTSDKEFRFTCNFQIPRSNGSNNLVQRGTCRGPASLSVPVVVNDEDGTQVPGIRVFAGRRLDSFFLDFQRIAKGQLGPDVVGKNSLQNKNVLSIVIEADMEKVFGSQAGSVFAVVGEVNTDSQPAIRVDRQGRSEMTNITLSMKQFDQVNKDLDVRDLYNRENTFKPLKDYVGAYRARFNANLAAWDNLDGKIDWQFKDNNQHPLTNLLLNDILVIDTAKPCTEQSYLAIEKALLADRSYETCGGRRPNEDTVDAALTLYINGGNGPHFGDGVNQPTQLASNKFPYLAPPYTTK